MLGNKYKSLNLDKSSFDVEAIKRLTEQIRSKRQAFENLNVAQPKGQSISLIRDSKKMAK